jgi:uncharacterized protein with HEPN domain
MRRDDQFLQDILDAIAHIQKYAAFGYERFQQDELVQTWCAHYLQIIGVAACSLSDGLRRFYSSVPWPQIIGMRNLLVHEYFIINLDEIWITVERDLPPLQQQVEGILRDERGS